jgi:hypothetical protein
VITIADVAQRKLREPYQLAPPGLRWRYAPYAEHPWHAIIPDDTRRLVGSGRRWRVRAQVRWEPDTRSDLVADLLRRTDLFEAPAPATRRGRAEVLVPRRSSRSAVLLEQVDPADASAWDDTYRARFTSLQQGLRCRAESTQNVIIHAAGGLGGSYTVTWNDLPVRRRFVRTRSDRFSVSTSPGIGRIDIETADRTPVQAWTNCQPTDLGTADVWRLRRTYAIRANRPAEFVVDAADDTWYVNLVAYGPPGGELRATFDDGSPRRRAGVVEQLTFPTRTFDWSGAALDTRVTNDAGRRLSDPILFSVPVGSDLAPGAHTLRLEWLGDPDETAWVRAFRYAETNTVAPAE